MDYNSLIEAVTYRAPKVREIGKAVEMLADNSNLMAFVDANQDLISTLKASEVADFLLMQASRMLDKRASLDIVKNIYDEYSVIFAILLLSTTSSKTERNFLTKMFIEIISTSAKFDIFVKPGLSGNNRRLSSAGYMIELFWLIPLFVNNKVLFAFDWKSFIEENQNIGSKVDGYIEGYNAFIITRITDIDKASYKDFLKEGVVSLSESIAA